MTLRVQLSSLILAGCCLVPPTWAQQVGVTSTAAGEPRGTPPAQSERILRVGVDIAANERIITRMNDRAHLVFLDGSALNVGPSSDVVIDRFVYDADRKVGDLAMSATRGVFRFVGGAISKKAEVVVRTPTSSVGIRGSVMTIAIGGDGATIATFLYGEAMMVSAQGTGQDAWFACLQGIGAQGINMQSSGRPVGSPPVTGGSPAGGGNQRGGGSGP